jgi:hypothetical protein
MKVITRTADVGNRSDFPQHDIARQADAEKFHALVAQMKDCDMQRVRNAATGSSRPKGLNKKEIEVLLAPFEHLDCVKNGERTAKQMQLQLNALLNYLGLQ